MQWLLFPYEVISHILPSWCCHPLGHIFFIYSAGCSAGGWVDITTHLTHPASIGIRKISGSYYTTFSESSGKCQGLYFWECRSSQI